MILLSPLSAYHEEIINSGKLIAQPLYCVDCRRHFCWPSMTFEAILNKLVHTVFIASSALLVAIADRHYAVLQQSQIKEMPFVFFAGNPFHRTANAT
jgi:hypothetical protein